MPTPARSRTRVTMVLTAVSMAATFGTRASGAAFLCSMLARNAALHATGHAAGAFRFCYIKDGCLRPLQANEMVGVHRQIGDTRPCSRCVLLLLSLLALVNVTRG